MSLGWLADASHHSDFLSHCNKVNQFIDVVLKLFFPCPSKSLGGSDVAVSFSTFLITRSESQIGFSGHNSHLSTSHPTEIAFQMSGAEKRLTTDKERTWGWWSRSWARLIFRDIEWMLLFQSLVSSRRAIESCTMTKKRSSGKKNIWIGLRGRCREQ